MLEESFSIPKLIIWCTILVCFTSEGGYESLSIPLAGVDDLHGGIICTIYYIPYILPQSNNYVCLSIFRLFGQDETRPVVAPLKDCHRFRSKVRVLRIGHVVPGFGAWYTTAAHRNFINCTKREEHGATSGK